MGNVFRPWELDTPLGAVVAEMEVPLLGQPAPSSFSPLDLQSQDLPSPFPLAFYLNKLSSVQQLLLHRAGPTRVL